MRDFSAIAAFAVFCARLSEKTRAVCSVCRNPVRCRAISISKTSATAGRGV
ncbi:MAG: hypothetical protein ACR2P5_07010 [Gammaproteobacteria bacterium]